MAERRDETEYRDSLTARQRVLGFDHPDTLTTARCIAHLEQRLSD
jgi:hypothetical protein